MPQVTIEHPDGSTDTLPATVGWEQTRELGKMRRLIIRVNRELLDTVTLQPTQDTVTLDGVDTVVLVDTKRGDATHDLVCYSAEWLDKRVPPTAGGALREGDDDALITGVINDVPAWTAGTINSYSTGLSFVFNHSRYAQALRTIERNVGGEVQFRDFGTVDYVESLGSDRTGSVTLSNTAGTIEREITITERGRELGGTHFRVLGAHEGEAQYFANLVPEDDPQTYENEVRYSTTRWQSSDDTDWSVWTNKDVADQATIEEEAASLASEIDTRHVEATTVVPTSVDLNIGDWVQVVKDDADLNREMRVHRIDRQAGEFADTEGDAVVWDKVLLSTRTTLRDDDDDDLVTREQFQTGYQGSSVADTSGPFGKAVDSGNPLEFKFRYPDLAFENTAQLQITGREYRVDSQGAASGGTTITDDDTEPGRAAASGISGGGYTTSTSWDTVDSFTTPDVASAYLVVQIATRYNILESDNQVELQWRVNGLAENFPSDEGTYQFIAQSSDQEGDGTMSASILIPGDVGNSSFFIEAQDNSGGGHSLNYVYNWMVVGQHTHSIDPHTHDINPGIFTTNDTPSNVDVAINGNTVATNIGTGLFETVIDVGGEFDNDAWNTVEVSSDSLGILEVSSYIEGYDKIGLN